MRLNSLWDTFPQMKEPLGKVSDELKRVLEETPSFIRSELKPLFDHPGKMLRPAFMIMASTVGEENPHLYKVAAAVELLHMASLVHDDIIDHSDQRRGQSTLYKKLGAKKAVLAGDYLLGRALNLASQIHHEYPIKMMGESISRLCLSEIEQDSGLGDFFISRDTYYSRIQGKTAELFSLSAAVGSFLGGAPEAVCDEFFLVGQDFGMAFQIFDDVQDYQGSLKNMGKAPGADLREGIPTLPLIMALEEEGPMVKLCKNPRTWGFSGRVRKRVLAGEWEKKAALVGQTFLDECCCRISLLDFKGKETFLSVVEEFHQ